MTVRPMLSVVGGTDLAGSVSKIGHPPASVLINPDWHGICHALEGIDPAQLATAPVEGLLSGMEARLAFCCRALSLPAQAWQEGLSAVRRCLEDASALSDFSARWGISTNWILIGDARAYVRVRTFTASGVRWAAD